MLWYVNKENTVSDVIRKQFILRMIYKNEI